MAEVITRFKLETTQYDSALRNESQRLAEFARKARDAGDQFGKFADKNAEAARALGNMATSATNSKDKVKELVGAYNEFARQYNALTKEQQQSDFAKAMAESLTVLKGRIAEAKQELYGLDAAAKQVKTDMSGGGFDQLLGGIAGKFGMSASMFTGVGAAVLAAGTAFKLIQDNVQTAMGFERSMSQLSALTGMVGKDLDRLKEYSIELGSTTTLTASQVADAFRLIGSQQPQLLSSAEALKEVTKYAITLSEAAGIDLATASQTLSTSINQFGGDSSKAAQFVNVLAAASQKGAGDISWLGEAVVKSGTYAKAVGASYEDLVANLETLAKAGYDAATSGTALRSIILALEKQADSELKPSVVGLTTAFENLGAKQLDISGYAAIVNQRFAAQAMTLAENAQQTRDMTEAITGTNIAEQQAETNVNNLSGAMKQLASAWEGFNLHLNDSNGPITDFINNLKDAVTWADALLTVEGRVRQASDKRNSTGRVENEIADLKKAKNPQAYYEQTVNDYEAEISKKYKQYLDSKENAFWNPFASLNADKYQGEYKAIRQELNDYKKQAEEILNPKAFTPPPVKVTIDDTDVEETKKSVSELNAEINTLKKLRDEAANKGNTALVAQYNTQIKAAQQELKNMRGGGSTPSGSSRQTPQQKAANIVETAEQNYAQTMMEASLRLSANLDDTEAYKKKELQAQEQLLTAYGKAYTTYADPRYKQAYDTAAWAYQYLAMEVKAEGEAAARRKESSKALEQAQKKLADAQSKLDIANQSGNLKEIRSAQKSVTNAQTEVERLQLEADTADAVKAVDAAVADMDAKRVVIPVEVEQPKPLNIRLTTENLAAYTNDLKQQLGQLDLGTEAYAKLNAQMVDATTLKTMMQVALQEGLNDIVLELGPMWQEILNADDIPDEVWQNLGAKLQEELKAGGSKKRYGINRMTGEVGEMRGENKNQQEQFAKGVQSMTGAVSSIAGGIQQLGVELPDGINRALAMMQGISTILTAILTITTLIKGEETVQTFTSFLPGFKNGGLVPHAATGMLIPGNDYSDRTPVYASSGELILNRAQQHNIAGQLEGVAQRNNGGGTPYVLGEQIWLGVNNYLRRNGRGEIVTANKR